MPVLSPQLNEQSKRRVMSVYNEINETKNITGKKIKDNPVFRAVFYALAFGLGFVCAAIFFSVSREPLDAFANDKRAINAHKQYESQTAKEECYLCGENKNMPLSFHLGENNIAVIDLNTFDYYIPQINRYDDDRQLIEQKAGFMNIGGTAFQTGERLHFYTDADRGSADGTIQLNANSLLSFDSVSSFLCADCLTGFMNCYTYDETHWNVALLNLQTKTLRPLEKSLGGFGLGEFSVKSRYDGENEKIDLLICYSPLRYE